MIIQEKPPAQDTKERPSPSPGPVLSRSTALFPGLYIHIPFCERKCSYCDFNSGVYAPEVRERYVRALLKDILASPFAGTRAQSAFFGGGTPSVLPASSIQRLMTALTGTFRLDADAEVTVECNPGTIASERMAGETTEAFLRHLKEAGVNRLSFGVQSLDAGLLKTLGRIHSPEQAIESVRLARDAGFANINIDLMFALPGQTRAQWADTLAGALALEPEHISAYSLIVEPDTPFALWDGQGRLPKVSQDDEAEMYETAIGTLTAAGYEHFEVSAFARPGKRSVHNAIYWRNEDYLGFGVGAASYTDGERSTREGRLESYVQLAETGKDTIVSRERLDRRGQMGETMMMGLRILDGVNREAFASRFGADPCAEFAGEIAALSRQGLLEVTPDAIRLTHRGLFLANEVWEAFV
ncbi:MAG TPA: radical SAM family heme chaperone HemW [Armatimonadota bacterium]